MLDHDLGWYQVWGMKRSDHGAGGFGCRRSCRDWAALSSPKGLSERGGQALGRGEVRMGSDVFVCVAHLSAVRGSYGGQGAAGGRLG